MGQLDPANQNHDFNPGIAENGVFWITRIPDRSVDVNPGAGRGRMALDDLDIEDYHDLENALLDGPSVEAEVSFDCRWSNPIARRQFRNAAADQQFTGSFTQTHATIEWSAEEQGFEFQSDRASTSTAVYAEVGEERNGVFFS